MPNVANEQAQLTVDEQSGKASIENLVEHSDAVKVNETVIGHGRPVELQSGDKVQVSERYFIFEYPTSSQNVKLSATPKAKTPVKRSPAKSSPKRTAAATQKGTPAKSKLSQFVVSADEVAASASPIAVETKVEIEPVVAVETVEVPLASTPVERAVVVCEAVQAEMVLSCAVEELVKSPRALAVREQEGSRACTPVYSEANAPSAAQLLFSPRKTPGSSAKKSGKKSVAAATLFSPRKQGKTPGSAGSARPSMGRVADKLLDDVTVDAIMANLQSFEQMASSSHESGPVDTMSALFSPQRKTASRKSTPGSAKSASSINVARKLKALASETNEPPRVHEPIPFMHTINSVNYDPVETPAFVVAPVEFVATPSKKVQFGPALSPEVFDKDQPSNLPIKRGTPIKLDGSVVQRKAPTSAFKAMQKKLDDSVQILRSAPAKPMKTVEVIKIRPLELPSPVVIGKESMVVDEPAQSPVADVFAEEPVPATVSAAIEPAVFENLVGVKELLKTPKQQADMMGFDAVKVMVKTPKALPEVALEESSEIFKTPSVKPATPKAKKNKTPVTITKNLVGVREMLTTPAEQKEVNFVGVKNMLKTPKYANDDMASLEDIQMMMKTPAVASDMINPATPNKRLSSHLGRGVETAAQHEIHTLSSQVDVEVPQSPLDTQDIASPISDKVMMTLVEQLYNDQVEMAVTVPALAVELEQQIVACEEITAAEPVSETIVEETFPIHEEMSIELEEMPNIPSKEPTPKKRAGRPPKKSVTVEDVATAEEVAPKRAVRKAKVVEPVEVAVEEAPKRGRRTKAVEPVVVEAEDIQPAVKKGRGRKPAIAAEEPAVTEEPVKSRRGRKVQETVMDTVEVEMQPEQAPVAPKKKGSRQTFVVEEEEEVAFVEEKPKKKGRGKAAIVVVEEEPVVEEKPKKKGRGKSQEPAVEPTVVDKPTRATKKSTAKAVDGEEEEHDKENSVAVPNKRTAARSTKTVKSATKEAPSPTATTITRKRKTAAVQEEEQVAVTTTRSVRRRK